MVGKMSQIWGSPPVTDQPQTASEQMFAFGKRSSRKPEYGKLRPSPEHQAPNWQGNTFSRSLLITCWGEFPSLSSHYMLGGLSPALFSLHAGGTFPRSLLIT